MSGRTINILLVVGWFFLIAGFVFYLAATGMALHGEDIRPFYVGTLFFGLVALVPVAVCISLQPIRRYNFETLEEILSVFTIVAYVVVALSLVFILRYYHQL